MIKGKSKGKTYCKNKGEFTKRARIVENWRKNGQKGKKIEHKLEKKKSCNKARKMG